MVQGLWLSNVMKKCELFRKHQVDMANVVINLDWKPLFQWLGFGVAPRMDTIKTHA